MKKWMLPATLWMALWMAQAVPIAYASALNGTADAAFDRQFGEHFFAQLWAAYPEMAISAGYYRTAERLWVPNDASRAERTRFLRTWLTRLHAIEPAALSAAHRTDWALLDNQFQSALWYLTEYRDWQWDPSNYNVADPIALLLDTDYAPLAQRLRTVLRRLQEVPAYYAAAKQNIETPVAELTTLAIEQNQGALSVLGDDLQKQVATAALSPGERALFTRRIAAARAAIADYVQWLQAWNAQHSATAGRSFRIGAAAYEKRFGYEIQTGDTAAHLYQRAQQEKAQVLTRMAVLADLLWPKYFPNTVKPADRLEVIGRVIDQLSVQHVARDDYFSEIRRLIPELEGWVSQHNLVALDSSRPLQVRETPLYKRGVAGASVDAPGPYNPTAQTYFNVTPLDDYTAEQAESYLREYNRWMLPILVIHEAIPGHYVQLVYANKSPSRIKSVFGNGAMIEGWAVYTERMMLESGFEGETAQAWLIYLKWNLRSICNTILDYGVHVLGLSEADGLQLLTHEAFQADAEAHEKWLRVTRSSVQLTSYFAGYAAIVDFRERQKAALGAQFDLKHFHEQFLSFGNAPVSVIEQLMTGAVAKAVPAPMMQAR